MRALAITAVALLWFASATPAQTVLGYSDCDREPEAWINIETVFSPYFIGTVAHELDHRLIMEQFASCNQFWSWLSDGGRRPHDSYNRMLLESRGFAASSIAAVHAGHFATLDVAVNHFATALAHAYPFGLTLAEARLRIYAAMQQHLVVQGRSLPPPMSDHWFRLVPRFWVWYGNLMVTAE